MPKLIIIVLFLTASICSAQSPYEGRTPQEDTSLVIGVFVPYYERPNMDLTLPGPPMYRTNEVKYLDRMANHFGVIMISDTIGVDTFYIGEIQGISDTGYWRENYPVIQRTPKGEVITPRYDPSPRVTLEIRPEDYYPNQNKPAMKKFEYRTNVSDFKDIQKNCDRLGALGWELVAVTPIVDTITFLLVFKIEIIE